MGKYLCPGLILLLSLSACSGKKSFQQNITQLEKNLSEQTSATTAHSLSTAYLDYVDHFPEDTIWNSRYLYRYAALSYRMQDVSAAIGALNRALEDYYTGDNSANNAQLLASFYREDLQKNAIAQVILAAAAWAYPGEQFNPEPDSDLHEVLEQLDTLRNQVFNPGTYTVNFPLANDYIISIEAFSRVAPRHPQTPDLLMKAAEMARGIKTYQKAIGLFNRLISSYPEHPKAPEALFMKAFTLDDGLQDYEAARSAYTIFLEKYPDDSFADDARFSLDNLGKDVNELIDRFEAESIDQ